MVTQKLSLDKLLDLIKDLPTASKISAIAALGTSGTLLAAGNAAVGMWKVYQEVASHRWFWEDHVVSGLAKLHQNGMVANPESLLPSFEMFTTGSMRYRKRSDWYSDKPLTENSLPPLTRRRDSWKMEESQWGMLVSAGNAAGHSWHLLGIILP